jgi:hypothetical protein
MDIAAMCPALTPMSVVLGISSFQLLFSANTMERS